MYSDSLNTESCSYEPNLTIKPTLIIRNIVQRND